MVKNYTDAQLLNRVKKLPNFVKIPDNYWILGVRVKQQEYNKFLCKFYLFKGEQFIMVMSGTTIPGSTALMNFESYGAKGAAVIVADKWYYNVWERGMHKGKVIAYRQVGGFDVARDNNKDKISGNVIGSSIEKDKGLNFHSSDYNLDSKVKKSEINGWSTGCQVVNDIPKYKELMRITSSQKVMSYCLINEF